MSKTDSYYANAAPNQIELEQRGPQVVQGFDTLQKATARAKYFITDDYARAAELGEPFGYASVEDGEGNCIDDFFRD